ncbi:uncharacterized protein LOC122030094 [Zingiber officinale]|uniref:uncharacterized protein LOC122030094 n=1 Tax=Zingiber officinale TaxID=94328 RepID=UPI001C4A7AC1|nr:uncharacterized protein LOC122030094 [Zingiber officinale]
MWIIIQTRFADPTEDGVLILCDKWDAPTRKRIKVDAKATQTLQCRLTKEELNQVGLFSSAKELWEKLIKLHERTSDTKEGESASQHHAQIQDLLNDLHAIGQKVKNCDIIRNEQHAGIKSKAQN